MPELGASIRLNDGDRFVPLAVQSRASESVRFVITVTVEEGAPVQLMMNFDGRSAADIVLNHGETCTLVAESLHARQVETKEMGSLIRVLIGDIVRESK